MSNSTNRLEQFAEHLKDEVRNKCEPDEGIPPLMAEAFTTVALELLVEHNEADDGTLAAYESPGKGRLTAAKCNAWNLSGDGATLDLFATLYLNEDSPTSVPRAEADRHFKMLRGFLRRARDGWHTKVEPSLPVFETMRQIHAARENLTTVRLFFLTDGVVKSGEILQEQMDDLELRYVLWDLDKLSRLQVGERGTIELDFVAQYGGPIPAIETSSANGEYRTYLAFLPGPVLAAIYGEHGQRLLERNVRAFLQARGKINKGLQQTLKEEPHRFLAYNNGLCCTSATVDADSTKDGHSLLRKLGDFQIVNGGQTTASLYHAMKKEQTDITNVVVQMKLTVLSSTDHIAEIVPLISRYANSQNKVNTADFSANDRFHQQLEALSRTISAPATSGLEKGTHWYYERARGSYLDDKARAGTPARQRKWLAEHPIAQKFTKTDVAKFEQTWDQRPHRVSLGAEKNFTDWTLARQSAELEQASAEFFRRLVAKAILFRATEKIVSAQNFGGYRANIVTYTLAWLSLETGQRLDMEKIWRNQTLSEAIETAITCICVAAHEAITSAERLKENVTEWCKQEECWKRFREVRIKLPNLTDELIAPDSDDSGNGGAVNEPQGNNGSKTRSSDLLAQLERLRSDIWPALEIWIRQTEELQPWQATFAGNLSRKLERGKRPSAMECREALALLREAQSRGFPH